MNQSVFDNYLYHKAYQNRTPISVMIEVLTKCNMRCKHCYIPEHNSNGLTLETLKRIFIELREMGTLNVSLTGGEIFLREDIYEIIEAARVQHLRVFLLSNGTMLNEASVQKLRDLRVAEFSTTMFSTQPEIHDAITQHPGSLRQLLISLSYLKRYNIRVKVKMPIMYMNAVSFNAVKQYASDNGFEFLASPIIFAKTNGDRGPISLRVSECEMPKILRQTDDINRKGMLQHTDVPCLALFYSFSIDSKGDVYPCNSFPYKIGNCYDESLNDIWHNSEALKLIQSIKKQDLHKCTSCELLDACDRCPGMVWAEENDLYACDLNAKSFAQIRINNYQR